jgi:predicted secreted protein
VSWVSLAAIYFVLWWLLLFAVLPFGIRSSEEAGEVNLGTERGAPHLPRLGLKMAVTTLIAAVLLAIVYVVFGVYGLTFEDFII